MVSHNSPICIFFCLTLAYTHNIQDVKFQDYSSSNFKSFLFTLFILFLLKCLRFGGFIFFATLQLTLLKHFLRNSELIDSARIDTVYPALVQEDEENDI